MKCRFLLLAACPAFALAQADPASLDQIAQWGKTENQAGALLREMTAKFGPRRTGSKSLFKAQNWVMSKLKSFGWKNVRLEKWGEVAVGFERGPGSFAMMHQPFRYLFDFSSPAWTPGTLGPKKALAVMCPSTAAEVKLQAQNLTGKWVIMPDLVPMRGSRRPDPLSPEARTKDPEGARKEDLEKALDEIAIQGRVFGESEKRNWLHTHGKFSGLDPKNLPKDVRVNLRYRDHGLIVRQLKAGLPVELEFSVDQTFLPGAVPQYNVVAEWPGTDKADEMVLFGGHLDSWDPPKSQGASDNGTGSMISLEAARLIAKAGAKPRRTLRFILFSGEEQGLLGSFGDVKALGDRGREKIMAMFNEDAGSNWHTELWAMPQWKEVMEQAVQATNKAFPEKPIKVNVTEDKWPRSGGSDHVAYLSSGIPAFGWGKKGPQNYGYIWHTTEDRFENTVPEGLIHMSTNTALTVLNVACAETFLWRPEKWPMATTDTPRVGGHDDHDHDH